MIGFAARWCCNLLSSKGVIFLAPKRKIFFTLFTSTFYISAVTFGGGYVIIPVMKKRFVDELKWIDEDEMLNLIAIAQSSPGAMAVNASLLIGYTVYGPFGAFLAVLGTVLPPLILLTIVSMFYSAFRENVIIGAVLKGMQAGVCAVISDVVYSMVSKVARERKIIPNIIMIGAFIATFIFKLNVILIILACALFGVLWSFINKERGNKDDIA